MSDRDLLALAAEAAKIEYGADRLDCGLSITLPSGHHKSLPRWNPLTDDGDALRLAVACDLDVCIDGNQVAAYGNHDGPPSIETGPDAFANARRAIVREAAKISRSMQHE